MSLTARLEHEVLALPWTTILTSPVVPLEPVACRPQPAMMAAVPFLTGWCGWMRLRCDVEVVREIAARMRAPDAVRSWDLDEAARWLAGVIAQALAPALDRETKLGSATILDATQQWTPRHCRPLARLCFAAGEHRIGIALDQRFPIASQSCADV